MRRPTYRPERVIVKAIPEQVVIEDEGVADDEEEGVEEEQEEAVEEVNYECAPGHPVENATGQNAAGQNYGRLGELGEKSNQYFLSDFDVPLGSVEFKLYDRNQMSLGTSIGSSTFGVSFYDSPAEGIIDVTALITAGYQGNLYAFWEVNGECQAGFFEWHD